MILAIIFLLVLLIVVYLLLMPIVLSIDTVRNEYYVQLRGLLKAFIEPHEDAIIRIRIRLFFFNFYYSPIDEYYKHKRKKKLKQKIDKVTKYKTKSRKRLSFIKGLKILRTFKVKQFYLNVDSGNVITNAKLYPAFSFFNYYLGGFNINFIGQNQLVLRLQNRPLDIIKIFINP